MVQWYKYNKYNIHGIFPITREKELEYIINSQNWKDNISLAIIAKKNDRLVGNIYLNNIDLINRIEEETHEKLENLIKIHSSIGFKQDGIAK